MLFLGHSVLYQNTLLPFSKLVVQVKHTELLSTMSY